MGNALTAVINNVSSSDLCTFTVDPLPTFLPALFWSTLSISSYVLVLRVAGVLEPNPVSLLMEAVTNISRILNQNFRKSL